MHFIKLILPYLLAGVQAIPTPNSGEASLDADVDAPGHLEARGLGRDSSRQSSRGRQAPAPAQRQGQGQAPAPPPPPPPYHVRNQDYQHDNDYGYPGMPEPVQINGEWVYPPRMYNQGRSDPAGKPSSSLGDYIFGR